MQHLPEFIGNHGLLVGALFLIIGMMVGMPLLDRMRGLKAVGPSDALGLMNHHDALLLDVREDGEYAGGHILGSQHVPLSKLPADMAKVKHDHDKPVIAVCASGSRSGKVCSMLLKEGFTDVYNLRGGIMAWKNASLPLNSGKK